MLAKIKDLISKLNSKKENQSEGPATILACDLGKSKVSFLEVLRADNQLTLSNFSVVPRPEKLGEGLKEFMESAGFLTNQVRISIKGHGVIVRFIQFPKMAEEDLRGAMTFEIEKYIPFKADEVIFDYIILDESVQAGDAEMMNLMLVVVKREEVYPLIESFQDLGLFVSLVDVDALAYTNSLEYFHPEISDKTVAVLDVGYEVSTLCIVEQGKPRFIRDISYGALDITKKLRRKLGIADEEAKKIIESDEAVSLEAQEVLKEAVAQLVTDLKVSFDYYSDQSSTAKAPEQLFMGGGGSCQPYVVEALSLELGFPSSTLNLGEKVQFAEGVNKEEVLKCQGLLPVALGLAIRP